MQWRYQRKHEEKYCTGTKRLKRIVFVAWRWGGSPDTVKNSAKEFGKLVFELDLS